MSIVFLSDLWGKEDIVWFDNYKNKLSNQFTIKFLDCQEIGGINSVTSTEQEIHQQFVEFGIENAVKYLLKNIYKPTVIVGFSVGGTIGWKAIKRGLKAKHFYGVSATRLRKEQENLDCPTILFYGEDDSYRPNKSWQNKMKLQPLTFSNQGHDFYKKANYAAKVCEYILHPARPENS